MLFKLVPRFLYLREHVLHRVAELDAEPAKDITLPGVVFRVDTRLDLFVVDHAGAEGVLRLGRVKRRTRLLNFGEKLLPVCERVTEAVEDVFGLEIPEGLELKPLADVVFELLDLVFDQNERPLQRSIWEARQLKCIG